MCKIKWKFDKIERYSVYLEICQINSVKIDIELKIFEKIQLNCFKLRSLWRISITSRKNVKFVWKIPRLVTTMKIFSVVQSCDTIIYLKKFENFRTMYLKLRISECLNKFDKIHYKRTLSR